MSTAPWLTQLQCPVTPVRRLEIYCRHVSQAGQGLLHAFDQAATEEDQVVPQAGDGQAVHRHAWTQTVRLLPSNSFVSTYCVRRIDVSSSSLSLFKVGGKNLKATERYPGGLGLEAPALHHALQ